MTTATIVLGLVGLVLAAGVIFVPGLWAAHREKKRADELFGVDKSPSEMTTEELRTEVVRLNELTTLNCKTVVFTVQIEMQVPARTGSEKVHVVFPTDPKVAWVFKPEAVESRFIGYETIDCVERK